MADHVRRARLVDVLGKAGDENVQGEEQQKLDVLLDPSLQIDVLNARQQLGVDGAAPGGELLDLRSRAIENFHIFHYNHDKLRYLEAIQRAWRLEPSERNFGVESVPEADWLAHDR